MPESLRAEAYLDLVRRALGEDIGPGDITTRAIVPDVAEAQGRVVAKERCVVAGLPVAEAVFVALDARIVWRAERRDGDRCEPGATVATVAGPAAALLAGERTALNFLQHLSGIATLTREFVDAAGRLTVLDTRKTLPGLRTLQKYAVRCGGGQNHRVGLFDAILIKDNHIRLAGGIAEAVRRVRAAGAPGPIEVETQTLEQVHEALAVRVEIIMLDNLDDAAVQVAVREIAGRARIELSGMMTLERVRRLAGSGADSVSIGALTHSARAADLSLELDIQAARSDPAGPAAVE
jgi:nicotinate-nucleotide pyrophosphorylase (carboxylating)